MIRSTKELIYDARNGEKKAIIEVEIISFNTLKEIVTYNVFDYAILEDGSKELINQKEVNYPAAKIDEVDAYLEAKNYFSGMSKTEKDWKKTQLGLLLDTQLKPLYNSSPEDWEITEDKNQSE